MDKSAIISLPNNSLRQRSKKISVITDEIKQLAEDMQSATISWEDSREHEVGVALAAVQVERLERLVVVRNDFNNKEDKSFQVLVNPTIVKKYGEIIEDFEGCLSIKNVYGQVPRYQKVKLKAKTLEGKEIRITAEGFLARVLQHEVDHTNGVVFIDHIRDSHDAFYALADDGKLEKLDYTIHIETGDLFND